MTGNKECVCDAAGFCSRRSTVVSQMHRDKCAAGHVEHVDSLYAKKIRNDTSATVSRSPGDVLHQAIEQQYGIVVSACSCQEWINRMNAWGPDGCQEHIEEIVDHLYDEASTNQQVSRVIRTLMQTPIIGPLEGKRRLRAMVQSAIDTSKATPSIRSSVEDIARFFRTPVAASDLPAGWKNWPNVVEHHRSLVRYAIERAPHECSTKYRVGRGAIIPAGGVCRVYDRARPTSYFWMAYTAAWNLRYRGFAYPIEFWFLPGEMEQIPGAERYAATVGATCHVVDTKGLRVTGGWQIKIHAILQSNLRYVLHLDADNLVATDPTYLFDLVEDRAGNDTVAHFWGDNPNLYDYRGYVDPSTWARLGSDRQTTDRDIETGQMVIDVHRAAKALYVVKHLAEHADYWGGFNGGDPGLWYGDKTDFHVAFVLTNTPMFIDQRFDWNPGGFYRHYGPDGKLVFEHCCHRKAEIVRGHTVTNCHSNYSISNAAAMRSTVSYPWKPTLTDVFAGISPSRQMSTGNPEEWQNDFARNNYGLPADMSGMVVVDAYYQSFAFARACACRGATVLCGGDDPSGENHHVKNFNTRNISPPGHVVWCNSPSALFVRSWQGSSPPAWIRCQSYMQFCDLIERYPGLFLGCPEVIWDGHTPAQSELPGAGWRVECIGKTKPFSRIVWVDSDSRID